jgi:hypothetical protein
MLAREVCQRAIPLAQRPAAVTLCRRGVVAPSTGASIASAIGIRLTF